MSRHAGFTLLEIMLAMLILGMVVAMVSVSLSASIKLADGTMEQGDVYSLGQVALERISEDLASAVLLEDADFIARQDSGDGDAMLTFVSMSHLGFSQDNAESGLGLISYGVQEDKEHPGQFLLLRADTLRRPAAEEQSGGEEAEAFLLADKLRSVKFTFLDQNGEEQEGWDTTKKDGEDKERLLPTAVTCRLEFWLDQERDSTVVLQTAVPLPVSLIRPQPKEQ